MKKHKNLENLLEHFLNQAEALGKIKINNMSNAYIRGYTSSNSLVSIKRKKLQERTCDECGKVTDDFYKDNTTCEECLCPEGT